MTVSRLACLWRRPEHPTPLHLRMAGLVWGFVAWFVLTATLDAGSALFVVLPVLGAAAVELWWQPQRAARAAARHAAAAALTVPDPNRPRDPSKDPATYRGRGAPPGREQSQALPLFLLSPVLTTAVIAIYDATGEDNIVLIVYGALAIVALLVASAVRRRRRAGISPPDPTPARPPGG